MEKLTPQNEHEEHMIQILLAKIQGVTVEYKRGTDWCPAAPGSLSFNTEYRIVPQPTPLPISREMWRMISPEWKWAVLDSNGYVYLFNSQPRLSESGIWIDIYGCTGLLSVLVINTDGINWEQSLTERPGGI